MSAPKTERSTLLRSLIVIVALVLLVPLFIMAFMMPMMGIMGMEGGAAPETVTPMSPLWGMVMMLIPLLVVLGVGYLIYRVFSRSSLDRRDPAVEELRLAYARGELSREEFEQRRRDLRDSE